MLTIQDNLMDQPKMEAAASVVILGNFDGIHLGHRTLLHEADQLAGEMGLRRRVITFSPHPKQAMGQPDFRLIYSEEQKQAIMEETQWVDELIMLSFDEKLRTMQPEEFFNEVLLKRYQAKAVVVGYNFRFGVKGSGNTALLQKLCQAHGLECRVVQKLEIVEEDVSSSRIRQLLQEGRVAEANLLLGRPYFVEGRVSYGKQLGRKLSMPTINVLMKEERMAPRKGVYISCTHTQKGTFASISNMGNNPTVGGESLRMETHILDFSGDLYEQTVRVELLKFVRPEQKFDSVEALQKQVALDIAAAKEYFLTER